MPLITLALGAYLAGLLAGFSGAATLALLAAAGAALVATVRRSAALAGCAIMLIAGVVAAYASAQSDAACSRSVAGAASVIAVLEEPAEPGDYVHARLACGLEVRVGITSGRADEGSTVRVEGDLRHARITVVRGPGLLPRWRTAARDAVDSTFGADAPLARALLVADTKQLSPEVRDRWAAAGLAHMLSISGLHVGLIAVALELVFQLLRLGRRPAALASLGVITLYVAVIGMPAPAVRSAAMLALFTISKLSQRPTSPWAILALGAAHPLLAPRVVLDLGYQLSVVGVAALIAGGQLIARLPLRKLPRMARTLAAAVIGTTVATVASAPLVAWVFGRVSLVAPLSNLAAAPLIGLAQPMLFLGLVLAPARPVARFVADAVHPLLAATDRVAEVSASLPGASLHVAPTLIDALLAGAASCAVLVACATRENRRALGVVGVAFAALAWRPLVPARGGDVELHMIDVGQGDAIALRTPHGHWVLVDAGRAWNGGDAGRSTILPYLTRRGGALDLFILSHPHTDHVGGAATVLHALHPARYVDAGFAGSAGAYRASLAAARDEHVAWTRAHPGDEIDVDGVGLTLLAPDSVWTSHLTDPNLASVVVLVRVGAIRILLMGDAEAPEEAWLLAHAGEALHADILKVGHHGSATSSTGAFLDAVRPRVALVSVGANNMYHHPSSEVLRALTDRGAQVLRTDRVGSIVARTDGQRVIIEAGGEKWELPPRSPPPSDP